MDILTLPSLNTASKVIFFGDLLERTFYQDATDYEDWGGFCNFATDRRRENPYTDRQPFGEKDSFLKLLLAVYISELKGFRSLC